MGGTAERVLDIAQRLAQMHGYNGFSYAHISAELGITKASIHHHFPNKTQLARALVVRYRERFNQSRTAFDATGMPATERLTGYAGLFAASFQDSGRMCLCGVFAVDTSDLPVEVRHEVASFFDEQRAWVSAVFLTTGMSGAHARRSAEAYLAALEGALLLARARSAGTTAGTATQATPATTRGIAPGPEADAVVLTVARTLIDALL